ncbi:MAG TPA: hypothetical protein O0X97_04290 [Methanocorpusculum sp.]|nr:hypothetical protein [Methanocorpusculum sp.]
MNSISETTPPDTHRHLNFDVIKMIIIFGLVPVHLFERCVLFEDYSVSHVGFTSIDSVLSTIIEFADGTIGACMFMFCLGAGLVFSLRKSAKFLLKRSGVLIIAAFVLALLTNTISLTIKSNLFQDPSLFEQGIWWLFCCDILNFASLAFLFFALVRKFKLPNWLVLAIPVILLIISSFIPEMIFPDSIVAADLMGWIVFQATEYSFFPFMQWIIFPAAGYVFAQLLLKAENREMFYGFTMLIGAAAFALITAISVLCGVDITTFFSTFNAYIYNKTPLSAAWSLSFMLFWVSLFFFLTRKISPASRFSRFAVSVSRRITVFYCLQWIIIGFLGFWVLPALGILPLNFAQMFLFAAAIIVVCYILAGFILKLLQKKRMSA